MTLSYREATKIAIGKINAPEKIIGIRDRRQLRLVNTAMLIIRKRCAECPDLWNDPETLCDIHSKRQQLTKATLYKIKLRAATPP